LRIGYRLRCATVAVRSNILFWRESMSARLPLGIFMVACFALIGQADQAFVKSKEAAEQAGKSASELQTWTFKDGMKVRGRVLAYGKKPLNVQKQLGRILINDQPFTRMEQLQQEVILKIVSYLETSKFDRLGFEMQYQQDAQQQRQIELLKLETTERDLVTQTRVTGDPPLDHPSPYRRSVCSEHYRFAPCNGKSTAS